MPYNLDSEDALELALLSIFEELGWQTTRAFEEAFSPQTATANKPYLGRANRGEVVLRTLNPDLLLPRLITGAVDVSELEIAGLET